MSLSLRECELKLLGYVRVVEIKGHSLYESVNWNPDLPVITEDEESHSLYESVNWNPKNVFFLLKTTQSLSLRECELK